MARGRNEARVICPTIRTYVEKIVSSIRRADSIVARRGSIPEGFARYKLSDSKGQMSRCELCFYSFSMRDLSAVFACFFRRGIMRFLRGQHESLD